MLECCCGRLDAHWSRACAYANAQTIEAARILKIVKRQSCSYKVATLRTTVSLKLPRPAYCYNVWLAMIGVAISVSSSCHDNEDKSALLRPED